jgi:hypothetical protein
VWPSIFASRSTAQHAGEAIDTSGDIDMNIDELNRVMIGTALDEEVDLPK